MRMATLPYFPPRVGLQDNTSADKQLANACILTTKQGGQTKSQPPLVMGKWLRPRPVRGHPRRYLPGGQETNTKLRASLQTCVQRTIRCGWAVGLPRLSDSYHSYPRRRQGMET